MKEIEITGDMSTWEAMVNVMEVATQQPTHYGSCEFLDISDGTLKDVDPEVVACMSEEQCGELVVDLGNDPAGAIQQLKRLLQAEMCPEEMPGEDKVIPIPIQGMDMEKELAPVIEIQERMAQLQKKIENTKADSTWLAMKSQCNQQLSAYIGLKTEFDSMKAELHNADGVFQKLVAAGQSKKYAQRYADFKKKFWDKANPVRKQRDEAYSQFQTLRDQLNKSVSGLWDEWWQLQKECQKMATPAVWAAYFKLITEELNRYFTYGDTSEVDDQVKLRSHTETMECYADEHVKEMKELES
jgi:uncharacterized small protein (DUF1192 family)